MDINKISFEQMSQNKGIEKAFEDFDVNGDNVINEQDAAAANVANQALAAEITNLLNGTDEEINLTDDAVFDEKETLQSDIEKLESDFRTNQTMLTTMSKTLETQQTDAVEEPSQINAAETVNSVTAADEVGEVNDVNEVSAVNEINATTNTTTKTEIKTMEEYKEILDCKFNELREKFGDTESCIQYMKNNLGSYMDGDGTVSSVEMEFLTRVKKKWKIGYIEI